MKEPIWLDRHDCLSIHEHMLAQHGGLAGVRDEGLLESALNRPHHLWTYGKPRLTDLAGAYAGGIIKSHPFLDGNKRTGFMLAVTFLEINGQNFEATEFTVVERTLALAAGEIPESKYAAWLKANSRKRG